MTFSNIHLNLIQVGKIGRLFVTKSDLGEELGILGLGYSLRDVYFDISNYSSHHALGTLADQLVRKGLLDAATAGGDDCQRDGEADQQHPAVDVKPE